MFREPLANMAMRSSSTSRSISSSTDAVDSTARLRNGDASPARSAPRAAALATSWPLRTPPLAKTGRSGLPAATRASRTYARLVTVGMPHSLNDAASLRWRSVVARCFSTSLQDVPPAPATSIALMPASIRLRATCRLIPQPTSLAMTGTPIRVQTSSIRASSPPQRVSPSGCNTSCKGFRCRINASASTISTARRL